MNLPVASHILYNILENTNFDKDYEIINLKLGDIKGSLIIELPRKQITQTLFTKYDSVNCTISPKLTVFETYGVTLSLYDAGENKTEMVLELPQTAMKKVDESMRRIVYSILKQNSNGGCTLSDISKFKSNLDKTIFLSVHDETEYCIKKLIKENIIMNENESDYTLDMGLFKIDVNLKGDNFTIHH